MKMLQEHWASTVICIGIFFQCGIRTDLPTKFLPYPNRDANHYATEHL